jgi:hypothetical protein
MPPEMLPRTHIGADGDLTPTEQAAIASKTMFDLYRAAGFTEDQALRITAYQIAAYEANHPEEQEH